MYLVQVYISKEGVHSRSCLICSIFSGIASNSDCKHQMIGLALILNLERCVRIYSWIHYNIPAELNWVPDEYNTQP
jgi:hypothetical protein